MIRVLTLGSFLWLFSCGPEAAVKCTSANCSGCCAETGECVGPPKQNAQACGGMGGACRVCLPQQLCSAGSCVRNPDAGVILDDAGTVTDMDAGQRDSGPAQCGARSQACCANQTCFLTLSCQRGICDVAMTNDAGPCGSQGQACCASQMCTAPNTTCNGTNCVVTTPDAGQDAGPLKATGEGCALDRECIDGACLVLGFNAGYCTKACTTSTDCVAGSQCGTNPSGVGPNKICLKQCSAPNTSPGGCRASYVCEPHAGTSGVPVCFPKCTSNTTCGTAPTCDSRGFCCGATGFACCEGTTCQSGSTCTSGNCVAGGAGGGGGAAAGGGGGAAAGGGGGAAAGGGGGAAAGGGGGTATGGGGGTTVGAVGAPCTNFVTQCTGNVCFTQQGTRWAGGYCSQTQPDNCASPNCPPGSSCSPYLAGNATSYCLKNCAWDGGQGDCRTAYVCDRYMVPGNNAATCNPACTTGSECGMGGICSNGFCCGKPFFRCCGSGAPCPGGGACNGGYCL